VGAVHSIINGRRRSWRWGPLHPRERTSLARPAKSA